MVMGAPETGSTSRPSILAAGEGLAVIAEAPLSGHAWEECIPCMGRPDLRRPGPAPADDHCTYIGRAEKGDEQGALDELGIHLECGPNSWQ